MIKLGGRSTSSFSIGLISTVLVAYAAALIVATAAGLAIVMASAVLADPGRFSSFAITLNELIPVWLAMLMLTAIFASPGYVITLLLSYLLGQRGRLFFAAAGAVTAFLAALLLSMWNGKLDSFFSYALTIWGVYPAGALGGLAARWALFGRRRTADRAYS